MLDAINLGARQIAEFVSGTICIIAALIVASSLVTEHGFLVRLPSAILFAFTANYFCTLVHELGHAIAAWSCKWNVHMIAVGSQGISPRTGRTYTFQSDDNKEIGGFVFATPAAPYPNRAQSIWVSFAGPLANFLLVAALLLYDNHLINSGYYDHGFLLSGTAAVSTVMGLLNLLPLQWGPDTESDGLKIFRSLFKSEWSEVTWARAKLQGAGYDFATLTASDWGVVKNAIGSNSDDFKDIEALALDQAWAQDDWIGFLNITEITKIEVDQLPSELRHKHLFCRCITGRSISEVPISPFNAGQDSDAQSPYFWLARSVAYIRLGGKTSAIEASTAARACFKVTGYELSAEIESVLSRVEAGNLSMETS